MMLLWLSTTKRCSCNGLTFQHCSRWCSVDVACHESVSIPPPPEVSTKCVGTPYPRIWGRSKPEYTGRRTESCGFPVGKPWLLLDRVLSSSYFPPPPTTTACCSLCQLAPPRQSHVLATDCPALLHFIAVASGNSADRVVGPRDWLKCG